MKNFEWDEEKRRRNLTKHGIDFIDAIEIFADPRRVEAEDIRNNESRYQTIGSIEGVIILLVYTYRAERRRIISARLASRAERTIYEKLNGDV